MTLGGSLSIANIQEIAKNNGYLIRSIRQMNKRGGHSVDEYIEKLFEISSIKDNNLKQQKAKMLLREIQSIRKVAHLETWENMEVLLEKWIKEGCNSIPRIN